MNGSQGRADGVLRRESISLCVRWAAGWGCQPMTEESSPDPTLPPHSGTASSVPFTRQTTCLACSRLHFTPEQRSPWTTAVHGSKRLAPAALDGEKGLPSTRLPLARQRSYILVLFSMLFSSKYKQYQKVKP